MSRVRHLLGVLHVLLVFRRLAACLERRSREVRPQLCADEMRELLHGLLQCREALLRVGFSLVGGGPQFDLDKTRFDTLVQTFGSQLLGADVGLFYYAGHGVEVRGTNYLVPTDEFFDDDRMVAPPVIGG